MELEQGHKQRKLRFYRKAIPYEKVMHKVDPDKAGICLD